MREAAIDCKKRMDEMGYIRNLEKTINGQGNLLSIEKNQISSKSS